MCSDPSLASAKSFEGSRVSTAGSAATIGWAGPWVVTHRQNGPDRMYPAKHRPDATTGDLRSHRSVGGTPGPGPHTYTPVGEHAAAASKQSATQPASVEWMLPHRHAQAPPAACPSDAAGVPARSYGSPGAQSTLAGTIKRPQSIPSAPAIVSQLGDAGRGAGSQIPSPIRNKTQQQAQHSAPYKTSHRADRSTQAAPTCRADAQAGLVAQAPYRQGQRSPPAGQHAPPFPVAATVRFPSLNRHGLYMSSWAKIVFHLTSRFPKDSLMFVC